MIKTRPHVSAALSAPVLAIVLLGGCVKQAPIVPVSALPEVGVVTLTPASTALFTELPGRTSAFLIAEVRPQVGGLLQKRTFHEGAEVKAGQLLYQIDPAPYRATLDRAEAALESAESLNTRYEKLLRINAISHQQADDARSQYLQAKAAAETARIDLAYTQITAPISGRIGRSSLTQGALLTANQTAALATIQQLDPIYVDITQPATALLQLKQDLASGKLKASGNGQAEAHLTLENGQTYAHAGKLQFSEVAVDQGTGSVTLRAVFPNPKGELLPGMFVRAQLREGVRENAILLEQRAVTRDTQGQALALVVGKEQTVEQRELTTERTVRGRLLISKGLQAGDRVIVDGIQHVQPGMQVKAVEINAGSASPASPSSLQ